LPSGPSVREHG